jgi:hypothetical protein
MMFASPRTRRVTDIQVIFLPSTVHVYYKYLYHSILLVSFEFLTHMLGSGGELLNGGIVEVAISAYINLKGSGIYIAY